MKDWRMLLAALFALAVAAGARAQDAPKSARSLVLATTTSVRDSGLMDELLPLFTKQTGIKPQLVAVGSGAALRMGEEGNADVLVTHEPDGEKAALERGTLVDRHEFMENYFVLVGPPGDPAGVAKAKDAVEAIALIVERRAPFASRADESGTFKREQALFKQAGLDASASWPGLMKTGAGMGATLQVAGEKGAYALSDVATFRAFQARTGLVAYSKPDPALRNVYSVLRPNPDKFPNRVDVAGAERFRDFLLSRDTQARIAAFGGSGGSLFTPLALDKTAP
jgi:tungstate transport system substrate-binding protein